MPESPPRKKPYSRPSGKCRGLLFINTGGGKGKTTAALLHAQLRQSGIKVREARSFGRPGWVRLVTRAPGQVEELIAITARYGGPGPD
jgi:hypothetical protein